MKEKDRRFAEENESFQKGHPFEFRTQELNDLDIISQSKFGPSTIKIWIAPFWSRENWYDGQSRHGGISTDIYFAKNHISTRDGYDRIMLYGRLLQLIIALALKILVENPKVDNFINNLIERDERLINLERIPKWDPMRPNSMDFDELTSVKLRALVGHQEEYRMAMKRAALFKELAECLTIAFKIDSEDTI